MSNTSKGLGRGINAFFNNQVTGEGEQDQGGNSPLTQLKITDIEPNPKQPRLTFTKEPLEELANSIRMNGVLQPILVLPANEDGKYTIIAGERRWRAAQMAGLEEIPAIIRNFDKKEALLATIVENLQRENLNPLEQAQGLATIMELLSLNQTELANAIGAQRGTISNLLRVLRLTPQAKEDLLGNRITLGHARCLVSLPEEESENLRQRVIDMGMNVRATEMALSFWNQNKQFPWNKQAPERKRSPIDANMSRISKQLASNLNCSAKINGTSQKGKINLKYDSEEQLYELLTKLGLSREEIDKDEPAE